MFAEESPLSENVSKEQVNDLISRLVETASLLGLYADPAVGLEIYQGDTDDLVLHVQFRVGKVAFTKRIQDPEQDKYDNSFREIESAEVSSQVEEIKESFRRRETPPEP